MFSIVYEISPVEEKKLPLTFSVPTHTLRLPLLNLFVDAAGDPLYLMDEIFEGVLSRLTIGRYISVCVCIRKIKVQMKIYCDFCVA